MATKGAEHWSSGISMPSGLSGAMQGVGGLFAMGADAVRFVFRRPFQWREFLDQSWFIARVALLPTFLVAIPFTVLISFILNILLRELGAADLSGAGAAFGAVTGPGVCLRRGRCTRRPAGCRVARAARPSERAAMIFPRPGAMR